MAGDTSRCGETWENPSFTSDTYSHCCARETWRDYDRCIWHAEVADDDGKPAEELVDRLAPNSIRELQAKSGYRELLVNAKLSGVELTDDDFLSGCFLASADLTDADLRRTDLTDANLLCSNLTNSNLSCANLSGTGMFGVKLTHTKIDEITVNQYTHLDRLPVELSKVIQLSQVLVSFELARQIILPNYSRKLEPEEWDSLAQNYHQFKNAFSEKGHGENARDAYVLERKARTRQAWFDGSPISFLGGVLSGLLTGYGVRPIRVLGASLAFLLFTAVWYDLAGFKPNGGPLYYTVVTFVTSPPNPPTGASLPTRLVILLETYLGTVLTVLLGYVLGNRERL